ncbi:MAG: hypothetical protein ABJA71_15075, partial [Ginsengibacter sp.]
MIKALPLRKIFLFTCLFFSFCQSFGQRTTISGTVYDITKKTPIDAVSVLSTSGSGTETDSTGHYTIQVYETDSIYFSYLNKSTPKYPVLSISNLAAFDISILKKISELPNVFVRQRSYKLDSLKNREDYAKIFNFRKPGLHSTMNPTPGSLGVGLDLDELINMFRFKRNRSILAFQQRLLKEEQDKFIDHRFSKSLVRTLTKLSSPELEVFMKDYRPTLEMAENLNELEFGQFIIDAFKYY